MKILCLLKNFTTQTPSGGYDRLASFLGADVIGRRTIASLPGRVLEKAWSFASGNKPYVFSDLGHGYRFADRLCEEQAFWRAIAQRPDIIHVLYGDWALDLLLRRARYLRGGLVATFHLPAEEVADRFDRVQKAELQRLGGAVVLSSADLPAYSGWLGRDKVMHIPHGINTDVFRPAAFIPNKAPRFVFIGMMLRDFEVAHRVIDCCRVDGLAAEFVIVIPPAGRSFFTGCTNAEILSGISEPELIALYRSCDALFLPLLHSTANNAILEALACGLPVISTRVGGVPDYVDEASGWLLPPGEFDPAFECVRAIVRNRELAARKRAAARLKAESFSWERVAGTMLDAYARLRRTGRFADDPAPPSGTELGFESTRARERSEKVTPP